SSSGPIIIGLVAMLGIGVLSAMVLMEPPMARPLDITDEERLERMLALGTTRHGEAQVSAGAGAGDSAGSGLKPAPASAGTAIAAHASNAVDLRYEVAEPGDRAGAAVDAVAQATLPDSATPAREDTVRQETAREGAVRPVSATVEAVGAPQAPPAPPPTLKPARTQPVQPAPVPRLGQAADGPYAIQFGAMSTPAAAQREIDRMRLSVPALFAQVEPSIEATRLDDGRTVNRMRIAGITRKADARAWCRAFQARGGSCYVVG
ncbi:MAG: SPOR domain-containing protein, partial [Pseudomonadota bacterium]